MITPSNQFSKELAVKVPYHTLDGIRRYVLDKVPPGGFLRAVLENNLVESFKRADSENQRHLFDIVNYIYNCTPYNCWGSPERVAAWLNPKETKDDNAGEGETTEGEAHGDGR